MAGFDKLNNTDITVNPSLVKYQLGFKADSFKSIKKLKPVFAFDYLSLNKTGFCYNAPLLGAKDYEKLLKGLKRISENTFETLNNERMFHFHDINWTDAKVSLQESEFCKCIDQKSSTTSDLDITAYQCKVFEEARILGFIYSGVFYLVMFDRGHNNYKRK